MLTTSSVDAPGSTLSSHSSRTFASVCVRWNVTGYGSSPRARIASTLARRFENSSVALGSLSLTELLVPLEDDAETVERQPGFVVLHRARVRDDRFREAARGDDFARPEFGHEAVDQAVDVRADAVDHARLNRLGRRFPDHVLGLDQLHAVQARRARE